MSYTKGEWLLEENKITGSIDVISEDRYFIISSAIDTDIIGERIDKANIKLIAAAPELLEAVKGLIYGIKMKIAFDTPDEQHKYNEALRTAKAAIEKATL